MLNREELRALCLKDPDAVIAIIEQLEARIVDLESRFNRNSHNSNNPPSSDRFRKTKSLRKTGIRHTGGQEGHKGTTLVQTEKPDAIQNHKPDSCEHCGANLHGVTTSSIEKRQVFGVIIKRHVVEHRSHQKECPHCHKLTRGQFPDQVTQPVQYDQSVISAAACFHNFGFVPYDPLSKMFRDILKIPISPATMINGDIRIAASLGSHDKAVRELLSQSPVIHCDETGFRVNADNQWLHVTSTEWLTLYQTHRSRGSAAIRDMGILPDYRGVAVHDCYTSYYQFSACDHALCIAHLMRELNGVLENTGHVWAQEMLDLLETIYDRIEDAKPCSHSLDLWTTGTFEQEFMRICEDGLAGIPPPVPIPGSLRRGRKRQSAEKNLLDRLIRRKRDILRCMYDFNVPFTNNQAERDLRMMKVRQKRSGGFRTHDGATMFCKIRGYISTAMKNGVSPFIAIQDALKGSPFIPQAPAMAE